MLDPDSPMGEDGTFEVPEEDRKAAQNWADLDDGA